MAEEEHPLGLGKPYLDVEPLPDGGANVGLPTEAEWVKRGGKVSKSAQPIERYRPVEDWETHLREYMLKVWEKASIDSQYDRLDYLYEVTDQMLRSLEQMPDLVKRGEARPLGRSAIKTMVDNRFQGSVEPETLGDAASILASGKLLEIRQQQLTTIVLS